MKAIKPFEFLRQAWAKRDSKKRAPGRFFFGTIVIGLMYILAGIYAVVQHFNKMSEWVWTSILAQGKIHYIITYEFSPYFCKIS